MQFLTLAVTQALLATVLAVPVANSVFSLDALNQDLFPEGKALVTKPDGTIWIAAADGESKLATAQLNEDQSVHGVQVGSNNQLVSSVNGKDTLSLTSEAFLAEGGFNKAVGCVNDNGDIQLFWGEATCANKVNVAVHANPIDQAASGIALSNKFCFGCMKPQCQPCACPPQQAPAPAPVKPCPPPAVHPTHAAPACSNEPNCNCCTQGCGGCASMCNCVSDLLCPSKWCGSCGQKECECPPAHQKPPAHCAPAPAPHTVITRVETICPAPTHQACNNCGSSSCGGGCPTINCGKCLKGMADCLCPWKKLPCNKPACQPQCEAPHHHVEPCNGHHDGHTVTTTVTGSVLPTAAASAPAADTAAPAVTPIAATTTRFHFVTLTTSSAAPAATA